MIKERQYQQMKKEYFGLGLTAFSMNHYDLAKMTSFHTPADWKEFLLRPEIADYKASERAIVQEATMNKIAQDAGTSNSVGKAQLLNALQKMNDGGKKEGPTFIYTYVPANEQQAKAANYREARKNTEGEYEFNE